MSVRCIRSGNNGENLTVKAPVVETNTNTSAIYDVTVSSGSVTLKIQPGTIVSNDSMPPLTNIVSSGYVWSASVNSTANLRIGYSGVSRVNCSSSNPTSYPYTIPGGQISGLTSGTTYYFRAFAISGVDTAYGAVKSFVAQSDPKSCKAVMGNTYPENITYNGATYPTVAIGTVTASQGPTSSAVGSTPCTLISRSRCTKGNLFL